VGVVAFARFSPDHIRVHRARAPCPFWVGCWDPAEAEPTPDVLLQVYSSHCRARRKFCARRSDPTGYARATTTLAADLSDLPACMGHRARSSQSPWLLRRWAALRFATLRRWVASVGLARDSHCFIDDGERHRRHVKLHQECSGRPEPATCAESQGAFPAQVGDAAGDRSRHLATKNSIVGPCPDARGRGSCRCWASPRSRPESPPRGRRRRIHQPLLDLREHLVGEGLGPEGELWERQCSRRMGSRATRDRVR